MTKQQEQTKLLAFVNAHVPHDYMQYQIVDNLIEFAPKDIQACDGVFPKVVLVIGQEQYSIDYEREGVTQVIARGVALARVIKMISHYIAWAYTSYFLERCTPMPKGLGYALNHAEEYDTI